MKLKKIYEIQALNSYTVRNGFTVQQSMAADCWTVKFGYLSAFLGWEHEIDENADDDSCIYKTLKKNAPTEHEGNELTAIYEIAGLVAGNRTAVKSNYSRIF